MRLRIVFHPLLFAAAPVLSLYVINAQYVYGSEASGTLLIMVGAAAGLWGLFGLLTRNLDKSALLTSIVLVTFSSYGRVWEVTDWQSAYLKLGLWLLLMAAATLLIGRAKRDFRLMSHLFNLVSVAWVAVIIMPYVYFSQMQGEEVRLSVEQAVNDWLALDQPSGPACQVDESTQARPDIYYIILDGYAREDILRQIYNKDNAEFTSFLKAHGFYIADHSTSNYAQTMFSLNSSLNIRYLDDVADKVVKAGGAALPVRAMIARNRVFEQFQQLGYHVMSFATGYSPTDVLGAGQRLAPAGDISPFQTEWLNSTPLPVILSAITGFDQHTAHRARVLFALEHLAEIAQDPAPTFTFAHVLAPHPPFVFGPNGEDTYTGGFRPFTIAEGSEFPGTQAEYVAAYRDQLTFITDKIQTAITQILSQSPEPPIIVIQSDHGPGSRLNWANVASSYLPERFSILNAYYFPDHDYAGLYPAISPVNTFRVIANQFFCGHYLLLPDKSYFSPIEQPYDLSDVMPAPQSKS